MAAKFTINFFLNFQMAENVEDPNRSFEGFEDDEERDEGMGDVSGDGGRRRFFSKVCFLFTRAWDPFHFDADPRSGSWS